MRGGNKRSRKFQRNMGKTNKQARQGHKCEICGNYVSIDTSIAGNTGGRIHYTCIATTN